VGSMMVLVKTFSFINLARAGAFQVKAFAVMQRLLFGDSWHFPILAFEEKLVKLLTCMNNCYWTYGF
jgi:hypothetical protein